MKLIIFIDNKILKYIPKIYAFYIPLSFALFIFCSITGIGHVFFGYIMDLVKICIILLFSYYVLKKYDLEDTYNNPSKYFLFFTGFCFLEFVVTICLHGKIDYGSTLLTYIYLFFFVAEFVSENIAIQKLDSAFDDNENKTWTLLNSTIAVFFIIEIVVHGFGLLIIIGLLCFFRELIRIHCILDFERPVKMGAES